MIAQQQTTDHQFFVEIQAAGRNGGSPALSHLWRLYLTFSKLRKRGYEVRLVGHYHQAQRLAWYSSRRCRAGPANGRE